jgi:hypothetical protein
MRFGDLKIDCTGSDGMGRGGETMARNGSFRSRAAGRYVAHRERPELCDEAARRLGLVDVVYRRFPEGEFIAGDDAGGTHRIYCARTWTEITPAPRPVGEQGRLL